MDPQIAGNWKELVDPMSETALQPDVLEIETKSGLFVLKTKDKEDDLQKSLHLVRAIRREGVPVEVPVETTSGDLYVTHGERLYCLFKRIVGNPINTGFEHIDCEMFGIAIARLHVALRKIPVDVVLPEMRFVEGLSWLTGGQQISDFSSDYPAYLSDTLEKIEALHKETIHRDPHPGNIIFEDGKLTGFIDLELSTMGPRIFDIVYCSTAMLSDLFTGQRDMWRLKIKEITDGYQSVCLLSDTERSLLIPTAIYIQQLFTRFYEHQGDAEKSKHNARIGRWLFAHREDLRIL
jgi:Ser/Thr protein kinase RdoA (MazF antagonist)